MTKDEAIDVLSRIKTNIIGKENWREVADALNIAVKSIVDNELIREEDKECLRWTLSNLAELKDRYGEGYGKVGKCIDWLNSLKDRIRPQPKQEWGEEDEIGWTNTMIMIKECATKHYTKDSIKLVINWLDSIKQRMGR